MTRGQRRREIRRIARTQDWLSTRTDPASLARLPTAAEHEELSRMLDAAGAQAATSWLARRYR